jgi:uncharacterized protein (TIGR03000 family)
MRGDEIMYSVVLLAAMSTGECTPAFGKHAHGTYTYGACYGPCYGVGYAGYGWQGQGGWGLPYGGYGPAGYPYYVQGPYGWPGYAGWGGCGCYSSPAYGYPAPVVAGPAETPRPADTLTKEEQVSVPDRARLIVELPANAKLYVDDRAISDAASTKSFRTPVLEKGQEFFYEVRVEAMRDGKAVSETRRIIVKAGAVVRSDFRSLGEPTGVAAARNR